MIFAVKLFSGFFSQFFLYLISIFSFFLFGKWIAKSTCQKVDLAVNVQLMLICHRTPSPIDPSVRTDSRWGEGGTLKVRGRDTKHVSCVCLGDRQTCGRKTTGRHNDVNSCHWVDQDTLRFWMRWLGLIWCSQKCSLGEGYHSISSLPVPRKQRIARLRHSSVLFIERDG